MEKLYQFIAFASFFLYWLLIAMVTLRIALKRRALGVSFAWLLVIYIFPIVGVLLYLIFGELKLNKKRLARAKSMFAPYQAWLQTANMSNAHQRNKLSLLARPVQDLCLNRTGIPALSGNQLKLHQDTRNILSQIEKDIHQAKYSIKMVFYIWHCGGLVDQIAQAICIAAKRGVKVQILLDSAGSRAFFRSRWPQKMRFYTVELIEALAVSPARMFLHRLDIRQHRKMVIIDNQLAYTGSMNMVDPQFFKAKSGIGEWIDIMVAVQGPAVPILSSIFCWDWEAETGNRDLPQLVTEANTHQYSETLQVVPSGPDMPNAIIQQVLLLAINQAQHSLTITTPYFVPSETLLHALQTTAQRGVNVDLIIPAKSDNLMVEWASRSFFSDLLNAGIRIHRFKGGLLHTKSVMVDDKFCLIGTVNIDLRSLWLNFELTLCIDDTHFCQDLIQLQQEYLSNADLIHKESWNNRSVFNKPIEQFFYLFSPLL